jgi:hypothetical protein
MIGEVKCEATRSVAGGGEAIVGRHRGMRARRISSYEKLARLDRGVRERDPGARAAPVELSIQPGFLIAPLRVVR